jgi:hypothetical protein
VNWYDEMHLHDEDDVITNEAHAIVFPAAAWVRCNSCEDYLCRLHDMHVHDCPCPPIEEWDQDPYSSGGPPKVEVVDRSPRAGGPAG